MRVAYFGGMLDSFIMRFTDMFMAIPETLLALCVVAAMGASASSLIFALTIAIIPGNCRLVRSAVLGVVDTEYVEAARACGMSDFRIIMTEILPNALSPIIVVSTQGVANIMLTASSLSYLGMVFNRQIRNWCHDCRCEEYLQSGTIYVCFRYCYRLTAQANLLEMVCAMR